jgi:hypothetical protein
MKAIIGVLLLAGVAQAQIGSGVGCFGFDGVPELACVGERVTCIARSTNYFPAELWNATSATIDVLHASGTESSGELLSGPVAVTPMGGSVDGAFMWSARPEDIPQVFIRGTTMMERAAFPGHVGGGSFGARVFVFQCDEPTLAAHRALAIQNRYRAVCEDNEQFNTRVCRSATTTFTAPIR